MWWKLASGLSNSSSRSALRTCQVVLMLKLHSVLQQDKSQEHLFAGVNSYSAVHYSHLGLLLLSSAPSHQNATGCPCL